jgi:phosphate:Na+ symporter
VLNAIGGLGLFLFALNLTSTHLQLLVGPVLNRLMRVSKRAPGIGIFAGLTIGAVIQSGTAVGMMTTGFADIGLLGVSEAMSVLLGGAVGGTMAVQIASLQVSHLSVPIIGVGYLLRFARGVLARHVGPALIGLGLAYLGLEILVKALGPVRDDPLVRQVAMVLSGSHVAMLFFGALVTLALNSSNAAAVLALAFVSSGAMPVEAGIAFVFGANIGTPLNVFMLSSDKSIVARRAAGAHLGIKAVTALIGLAVIGVKPGWLDHSAQAVANTHTVYNIIVAVICLPFLRWIEKWMGTLMPDPVSNELRPRYLDDLALETPKLAFSSAFREVTHIGDLVVEMLQATLATVLREAKHSERILKGEDTVDALVHATVVYLSKVEEGLPRAPVQALLGVCANLEAIADLLKRLLRQKEKLLERGLRFPDQELEELDGVARWTFKRMKLAFTALSVGDPRTARSFNHNTLHLHELAERSRLAHLRRLGTGDDELELTSAVHLDMLTILEQINSAVNSIAAHIPQLEVRLTDTVDEMFGR